MNDTSRVTDPYWADRIDRAQTDHQAMGEAWSYLLSTLAKTTSTDAHANTVRRHVTAELIRITEALP